MVVRSYVGAEGWPDIERLFLVVADCRFDDFATAALPFRLKPLSPIREIFHMDTENSHLLTGGSLKALSGHRIKTAGEDTQCAGLWRAGWTALEDNCRTRGKTCRETLSAFPPRTCQMRASVEKRGHVC